MQKRLSPLQTQERRKRERQIRGKLLKLLKEGQGFMGGSLGQKVRTCGNPGCKCARGEKHPALYLERKKNGRKQLYVPVDWADDVRQWAANYQIMHQLLDELSEIWWENVKRREL